MLSPSHKHKRKYNGSKTILANKNDLLYYIADIYITTYTQTQTQTQGRRNNLANNSEE
jgi:hypothetical protein